ncbi:MAG: hypothetical protein J6Y37_13955 [Paludibacteraceae bacterium]|nr:hypothetical protein [Paludibacteraceae bacterium]
MKQTIKVDEQQLRKIISEAISSQMNANEYQRYMNVLNGAYRACWTLIKLWEQLERANIHCASEEMKTLVEKLANLDIIDQVEGTICCEMARAYREIYGKEPMDGLYHGEQGQMNEEGIHIKDENKGKFNATKERTGKSTEELTHSKNPVTRKRAIFAQNAKKWKK